LVEVETDFQKRVKPAIAAVEATIRDPVPAGKLYGGIWGLVFSHVPESDWSAWDEVSGLFSGGWTGLMGARLLARALAGRVDAALAIYRQSAAARQDPAFVSGTLLLTALSWAAVRRRNELARHARKQAREREAVTADATS
jgi:hypothetical protein